MIKSLCLLLLLAATLSSARPCSKCGCRPERRREDEPLFPRSIVFNNTGYFSFTVPGHGTQTLVVQLWGGGGGSPCQVNSSAIYTSGGGGGGGYAQATIQLAAGQVLTGFVGSGGFATIHDSIASNGGTSSVTLPSGTLLSATGGHAALGSNTAGITAGGAGGSASLVNHGNVVSHSFFNGQHGSYGVTGSEPNVDGAGGGSPFGGAGGQVSIQNPLNGEAPANPGLAPGGGAGGCIWLGSSLDPSVPGVGGAGAVSISFLE